MGDMQYVLEVEGTVRQQERHTVPLLLKDKDEPVVFNSIDDALITARELRSGNPERRLNVREYYGRSRYAFELFTAGTWKLSAHVFASIMSDGSEHRFGEPLPYKPGPAIRIS
ncbi:MAG TPA: hypothetical protein VLJ21_04350 [Candidatus Binatia bacterium]|nr:hypothetical protein [Candidatus Binatia bacterium]